MSVKLSWIEKDRNNIRTSKEIKEALEKGTTGILRGVSEASKSDVFYMLCFCLCVPQAKAVKVNAAIQELKDLDFLNNPLSESYLSQFLRSKVRFHNNKTKYLIQAQQKFDSFFPNLISAYKSYETQKPQNKFEFLKKTRDWLIKSFKGMGFKESSHFLRNIGMSGLAILDVHIMNGLRKRGLLGDGISLTNSSYRDIEAIMLQYSFDVGVSIGELDLLLWSDETGFVFK